MASESEDFYIFSTMRRDESIPLNIEYQGKTVPTSSFYMFDYHRDRLFAAAKAFKLFEAASFIKDPMFPLTLTNEIETHVHEQHTPEERKAPLRIRIAISRTGELSLTSAPTPAVPLSLLFPESLPPPPSSSSSSSSSADPPPFPASWTITLHPTPLPITLYTVHKTSHRPHYAAARANDTLPATHEVLLQNKNGEISEGTRSTPYFWRDGRWVTPRGKAGGNVGTTRRWALEYGLAVKAEVRADSVRVGEVVWLSNGVRGWGWGFVEERKE